MRARFVIVFWLAIAGSASAQPARELYEEGLRHYGAGEYDEAIAAWQASYDLSKAPLLLFNLGQAHRLKGDCAAARRLYERYRAEEPQPKNLDELVAAEALCRDAAPEPPPVVEPPPPAVAAPPPVVASPAPAAVPPPPRRSRRGQRVAGLVTGGAGLVAGGAAVFFGLRAADAEATVEERVGEWTRELADLEARGRRDQTIALVASAAGAAAIVTGTVLYLLGRDDAAVEVSPARGGAAVSWRVRF
jgi:tetratricopeptide (TPR) repeat protein